MNWRAHPPNVPGIWLLATHRGDSLICILRTYPGPLSAIVDPLSADGILQAGQMPQNLEEPALCPVHELVLPETMRAGLLWLGPLPFVPKDKDLCPEPRIPILPRHGPLTGTATAYPGHQAGHALRTGPDDPAEQRRRAQDRTGVKFGRDGHPATMRQESAAEEAEVPPEASTDTPSASVARLEHE